MNERSFILEARLIEESDLSRGEKTRREIIQAAYELFIEQGYHGTSMRQIAKKANLALGSLYNHFPSKDEVFQAVFHAYHPVHEVLPALLNAQGDTVEEFLRGAVSNMAAAFEKRPKFLNLMFIETVEFESTHVKAMFLSYLPKMMEIVQAVYQKNSHRLRPIPLPMLLRTFMGVFFSYYITEILLASIAPPSFRENAMDSFLDVYVHGILKAE